jgi:hypothetical protein
MEQRNKIKNLLGVMACLSALGLAVELAVAASNGSSMQRVLLILPVVFSGILVLLVVRLLLLAKEMPDGERIRQNVFSCLIVLGVQTGYCLLMATGKVGLEPGTFGDIFAFLGYFSVLRLVYDFHKQKPAGDPTEEP